MSWEGRKDAGEQFGIQLQAQNDGRITLRFYKVGETELGEHSSQSPAKETQLISLH